MLVKLSLAYKR